MSFAVRLAHSNAYRANISLLFTQRIPNFSSSRKWTFSPCAGPCNTKVRLSGRKVSHEVTLVKHSSRPTVPYLRTSATHRSTRRPPRLWLTWSWIFRKSDVSVYAKDLQMAIVTTVPCSIDASKNTHNILDGQLRYRVVYRGQLLSHLLNEGMPISLALSEIWVVH